MFETDDFRKQVEYAFVKEAANNNMKEYEGGIAEYLQRLASANESALMEREFRKAISQRRGIPDALRSVEELTRDASRYARLEGRDILRLTDIQKAYEAKFCQYWPFCKS